MTKTYYTVDPEPDENGETGFVTVHYKRPTAGRVSYPSQPDKHGNVEYKRYPDINMREVKAKREKAKKREAELEEIMAHPLSRYRYEKEQKIRCVVKRLQKDPKWYKYSESELYRYVRGYIGNMDEPIVWTKAKTEAELQKERADKMQKRGARRGTRRTQKLEQDAEDGNFTKKVFDQEFIDRVRSIRESRKMTQKDLAMLINKPEGYIRDFELGKLDYDGGLKSILIWKLGIQN